MKNSFVFLFVTLLYAACTGTTSTSDSGTSTGSAMALPYTAAYSSNFSIGSDSTVANVLNNYKAWENNDMEAFENTFGDSLTANFSNGFKFKATRDSAMKMASIYRDSLFKIEIKMDAWIPLQANDKNENWVSVWYTEIDTYKTGKVDSAYFQDDNMLDKNGKIVYIDSHKRVLN
ncbi:MAG TPA: hypothetical protein VFW07_16620 [Parafilimonas sp.]|nr:hypothetical protein [Parafilimonas sp.]